MNRVIIIGNGFDLAHGLETSYKHFIEHYWSEVKSVDYEDELINFTKLLSNDLQLGGCKSFSEINARLSVGGTRYAKLNFKNSFFATIISAHDISGWVDIEMLYYSRLKSFLKSDTSLENRLNFSKALNTDLDKFTKIFEEYLIKNVKPHIPNTKINYLDQPFWSSNFLLDNEREIFRREFSKKHLPVSLHRSLNDNTTVKFDDTVILNFNYTDLIKNYNIPRCTVYNIHGELMNEENPILLGFGDESDSFYKVIEDFNENELMKYIKSFYYLQSDEYRKAFDFLEAQEYQVQIMGHSCALSDRTLLEAVVNHQNCKSVKIFFHKDQEGKDNYTDIANSLSRHFPDKKRMREIVVNKKFSNQLPQHWW